MAEEDRNSATIDTHDEPPETPIAVSVTKYPVPLTSYVQEVVRKPESSRTGLTKIREAALADAFSTELEVFKHELRNALAPIQHATYRLRKKIADLCRNLALDPSALSEIEELTNILETAHNEAANIMHYQKIGQFRQNDPDVVPREVPLRDLSLSSILRAKVQAWDLLMERSIVIHPHGLEKNIGIQGDPIKLTMVLNNIFLNAVQSMGEVSERAGVITIELSQDAEKTQVIVRDNGVGIRQADSDKIFEQAFTTKQGGHGFGLSVCRQLMREMKGDMRLVNNCDRGDLENDGNEKLGASAILEFPR